MKTNAAPSISTEDLEDWDQNEADSAKDVYFPDDPTGDIERTVRLRFAFQEAGYLVRAVEQAIQQPTVWIIRLRLGPEQIFDSDQLTIRAREILHNLDIPARSADILTQRTGDRILVSFVIQPTSNIKFKRKLRRGLDEQP